MANIIDALVVTLGLDTKQFKKESKETKDSLRETGQQAKKAGDEIVDAMDKRATQALTKFKNEALTITGIFLGGMGLKEFAMHSISAQAELGRTSKVLGVTTGRLEAMQRAVKNQGGSAEGITGTMNALADSFERFQDFGESSPLVDNMRRFFGDVKRNADGSLDVMDLMLRAADKMKDMTPEQARAFGAQFGMDQGTVNLLEKGRDEVERLVAAQERLGVTSKKDAEEAQRMQESINNMSNAAERAGRNILGTLAPALEKTFNFAADVIKPTDNKAGQEDLKRGDWYAASKDLPAGEFIDAAISSVIPHDTRKRTYASGRGSPNQLGRSAGSGSKSPSGRGGGIDILSLISTAGWSTDQARGIVANLLRESKLNPGAIGDGGKAYGIAQWHPDRQAEFQKWSGKSIVGSSVSDQIGFLLYELSSGNERGAGKRMHGATTAEQTAALMSMFYERPADRAGEASRRAAMAREIHIGQITINTQATDAKGIANGIHRELVAQADSGLN